MVDRMQTYSRFRNCFETTDDDGALFTVDDTPFPYVDLADNGTYEVRAGDQWWDIARAVFHPLPYAQHLYWLLMDFQPVPYLDPTVPPSAGTNLVVPSLATIRSKVLDPARRREQ
jgi:hypothetical protein